MILALLDLVSAMQKGLAFACQGATWTFLSQKVVGTLFRCHPESCDLSIVVLAWRRPRVQHELVGSSLHWLALHCSAPRNYHKDLLAKPWPWARDAQHRPARPVSHSDMP